jgi:hypothetical protein
MNSRGGSERITPLFLYPFMELPRKGYDPPCKEQEKKGKTWNDSYYWTFCANIRCRATVRFPQSEKDPLSDISSSSRHTAESTSQLLVNSRSQ